MRSIEFDRKVFAQMICFVLYHKVFDWMLFCSIEFDRKVFAD